MFKYFGEPQAQMNAGVGKLSAENVKDVSTLMLLSHINTYNTTQYTTH